MASVATICLRPSTASTRRKSLPNLASPIRATDWQAACQRAANCRDIHPENVRAACKQEHESGARTLGSRRNGDDQFRSAIMTFGLTSEQKLLQESVRKLHERHAPRTYIRDLERNNA